MSTHCCQNHAMSIVVLFYYFINFLRTLMAPHILSHQGVNLKAYVTLPAFPFP